MRNVDPANDIPMTELTIEAQKERVKSFANKTRPALTQYCGGTEIHTQTTLQVTSPVNSGYMALSLRLDKRETQNKGAAAADIRYWFPEM
ncbi:hypothetical protein [Vibrio sp. B181a]|uniref:hypothetical protein n=1 Tax=Vibrio sp. B181a TaxID=2835906 RepID=UPI0025551B5A|nr:hypothetical protein [Vibrio sp. B181a]MDK9773337.1 hypothetical protein [Vibrio sp. B181a]